MVATVSGLAIASPQVIRRKVTGFSDPRQIESPRALQKKTTKPIFNSNKIPPRDFARTLAQSVNTGDVGPALEIVKSAAPNANIDQVLLAMKKFGENIAKHPELAVSMKEITKGVPNILRMLEKYNYSPAAVAKYLVDAIKQFKASAPEFAGIAEQYVKEFVQALNLGDQVIAAGIASNLRSLGLGNETPQLAQVDELMKNFGLVTPTAIRKLVSAILPNNRQNAKVDSSRNIAA